VKHCHETKFRYEVCLRLICLLINVSVASKVFSQHYQFKNISVEEGLPSSFVFECTEDEQGYLLLATDNGICRFDGREFSLLGAENGLSAHNYFHIATNPVTHEIWAISIDFNLYKGKHNRFKHIPVPEAIAWFTFDDKGTTWALSRLGSVYMIKAGADTAVLYQTAPGEMEEVATHINLTGNGEFMISDRRAIFVREHNGRFHDLGIPVKGSRWYIAARIYKRNNGSLLMSIHEGLYSFNEKTMKASKIWNSTGNEIFCSYEDKTDGSLWIGTAKGIYRFEKGIIDEAHLSRYLTDQIISSIFKHSEGGIWVSTFESGVFCTYREALHYTAEDGLADESVQHISALGRDVFGVSRKSAVSLIRDEKARPYLTMKASPLIRELIKLEDQLLLCASAGFILDSKSVKQIILTGRLYSEVFYGDTLKWYLKSEIGATDYTGERLPDLNPYDREIDKLSASQGIELLLIDRREGKLYAREQNGFAIIDPTRKPGEMEHVSLGSRVTAMLKIGNKIFAATNEKGLAILSRDGKITYLNVTNVLPSNTCNNLYYDKKHIWLATPKGLTRVSITPEGEVTQISNFTRHDLVLFDEINDITGLGNRIYVATPKGISVLDADVQLAAGKGAPHFESVSINNADTAILPEYTLSYDQNNINIRYDYVSLRSGNNVLYKYTFSENAADTGFIYTSASNVQLTSLLPGKYTFTLWAKGVNGNWSSVPARLLFTINPPFWQTWWFIGLCILTGVGIATYIGILIVLNIRRKNRFRHRLVESELRALRLYINPHFIFNTLNSLHFFILKNDKEAAGSYILSFSRLIRLIMNFSSRSSVSLAEERDLLVRYIGLEQIRFEEKFKYLISIADDLDIHTINIPPLIIQPFVENAIKHGLSGRGKGAELQVRFEKQDELVVCTVSDNGIGRKEAGLKQLSISGEHDSTGIRYIKERLKLLVNQKDFEPVIIKDKYEDGIAAGTEVTLLIPIL
jgi:ligand-binding sensor domain-containing protein/two-component sensor histidine kinase